MIEGIHWLGHDSFRFDGEVTVYVDPWKLKPGQPKADLILITHDHYDHCSPEDVAEISGPDTAIVTIKSCANKVKGQVHIVKPGDKTTVKGVKIEAVPAYNTNKTFHPKDAGHVGFIFELGGRRIYHAGDTDLIPEMADFRVDVALLPVSGIYVMTAEEAAQAATRINPQLAIPMHYGAGIGTSEDGERFARLAKVKVTVLQPE